MRRSLTDTTTNAVRDALTKTGQQMGGPATGVVLNLIVKTDEAGQHDALRAASQASLEHPCRVLGVITRDATSPARLDAEIAVGEDSPGQLVVLRIYGELGMHADSVIIPLLVADTPVVIWWPGMDPAGMTPSADPLGQLAQRRITDSAASAAPVTSLRSLAGQYQPGDTDLAWTRTTSWRSLLAATLDRPHGGLESVAVSAELGNPSAELIAAWLASRLGVPVHRVTTAGPGITGVTFSSAAGEIAISRPDGRIATLARPGEPDRHVALHRRMTAELLAEELRRLDPDEVYGEALAMVAKVTGKD